MVNLLTNFRQSAVGKYNALRQFLRHDNGGIMQRRMLLIGMAVAPLTIALARSEHAAERAGATMSVEELQKNWKMYLAESADVVLSTEPLKRSEAEWKQVLTAPQYDVLRREGT